MYGGGHENWREEMQALRAQIQRLMDQQAIDQRKLRYQLEVMNMRDGWQFPFEDNVDATHPLQFDIYIPPTAKDIKQVLLRLKLKAFRAYSKGNSSGGGSTETSSSEGFSFYTLHTMTGPGGTDGHGHPHDDIYVANSGIHNHTVDIPAHTHGINYGIYTSTSATGVTVTINGTDRTAALGGGAGFTTDQDELDITQYLTATGWNTIALGSTQLGRIHATTFVNLYLPS